MHEKAPKVEMPVELKKQIRKNEKGGCWIMEKKRTYPCR